MLAAKKKSKKKSGSRNMLRRRPILNSHMVVFGLGIIVAICGYIIVFGSHAAVTTAPTNPLPFNLPSQAALKGSPKKVFAHYFTPYPISMDNQAPGSDGYETALLNPNGQNGIHAAYGGLLRERPLPQAPLATASWELENMKTEVRRASAAGLDGFTADILSLPGSAASYNWDRLKLLVQAAPLVDPNFKILLMPDGNASDTNDPAALAAAVASIASSPAVYHLPDGRLVISPFDPEHRGVAYWQNWLNTMQNQYGIKVAFVPCFLNYGVNVASFAPFSYGFSTWGNRSPAANANFSANLNDAHARGKIWMQPVSIQDNRPNQGIYDEANNSENLRVTWDAAISGADWVQIPTWNDYSESAEISPSTRIGWSPLDLTSYYLTRFKSGAWPAIVRDVLYVSHRIQPAAAKPTGAQTKLMVLRAGGSPARDKVEVLSFLTAPGTVQASIGGKSVSVSAPAGVSSQLFDLAPGSVSALLSRGGAPVTSVASPFTVASTQVVQNLLYHFVSSGRTGLVYAPPPTPTPKPTPSPTPPPTPIPTPIATVVPTPIPTPTPVPTPAPSALGLSATYYPSMDFTGVGVSRVDPTVNFSWGSGSPAAGLPVDGFSARWVGKLTPKVSDTYILSLSGDDGVRLWVDGNLVANGWSDHSTATYSGTLKLKAGQAYDLRIEYYENTQVANIKFQWQRLGGAVEVVPAAVLAPTVAKGLAATYFSYSSLGDYTPVMARTDPTINFDWLLLGPVLSMPIDNFAVSWIGKITVPATTKYTFTTVSDDGVRLWVDGKLVIDHWTDHSAANGQDTALVTLAAGHKYDIKMDYYEAGALATAKLYWSSPTIPKVIVPASALSTN